MKSETVELCTQRAEWRHRLLMAIASGKFDAEVIVELLNAGWAQAHTEGLQDASDICQDVANAMGNPVQKHVAQRLANACLELVALNKATSQI